MRLREQEQRVSVYASAFPRRLREIEHPPDTIYSVGNLPDWSTEVIAVVGSRNMTPYGQYCTQLFVSSFVRAGLVIASGLAVGVDAEAHKTALAQGGKTVAVLPSGPRRILPASHEQLAQEILEKDGAIVSEFPTGIQPQKYQYHRRNRILAGLSDIVLVIEAGEKSGTLITAGYAAEMGRVLCVVPSPITNPNSAGVKRLLNLGAKIVMTPLDVYEECTSIQTSGTADLISLSDSAPIQRDQHDLYRVVSSFGMLESQLAAQLLSSSPMQYLKSEQALQKKRKLQKSQDYLSLRYSSLNRSI